MRLTADILVALALRRAQILGLPIYVAHKGAAESGAILVKINQLEAGCRLLSQARDAEGTLIWLDRGLKPEAEVEAAIARARAIDPDLWVVEIEDRQGRNPFIEG